LFNAGVRPSINVGLSVSRVGGAAQTNIIKKLGGSLRLELAQYREIEAFAKFGSDLDERTQARLNRGQRMVEILKQPQYSPMSVGEMSLVLYAGTKGYLDEIEVRDVSKYENEILSFVNHEDSDLISQIDKEAKLTEDIDKRLKSVCEKFGKVFKKGE